MAIGDIGSVLGSLEFETNIYDDPDTTNTAGTAGSKIYPSHWAEEAQDRVLPNTQNVEEIRNDWFWF